jgi:hypothetical protein
MRHHLAVATIAGASLLVLAGCDSRDYEAEIATLQSELEGAQSENAQMTTELEELRAQSEAQGAMPEGGTEEVQSQLNNVVQTAAQSYERAASGAADAEALQADMQLIVQSAQAAAEGLGIELEIVTLDTDSGATEGTPEPAAGPETQQQGETGTQEQPAAGQEQPAAQEEQPAAEQEQPATAQ